MYSYNTPESISDCIHCRLNILHSDKEITCKNCKKKVKVEEGKLWKIIQCFIYCPDCNKIKNL